MTRRNNHSTNQYFINIRQKFMHYKAGRNYVKRIGDNQVLMLLKKLCNNHFVTMLFDMSIYVNHILIIHTQNRCFT